jgi:hypothetical protein
MKHTGLILTNNEFCNLLAESCNEALWCSTDLWLMKANTKNKFDNTEPKKSRAHIIEEEKLSCSCEGIIIPAHSSHYIAATEQFKMISSTIKSYEYLSRRTASRSKAALFIN